MKAYSTDPRGRVVAACDAREGTRGQVAARFSVSVEWIRKILRQRRDTGSIAPKPRGGGRARSFDQDAGRRLRQAVARDNDATLAELAHAAGVACSVSVVHRESKMLGIARKKKSRRAAEQDRPALKAERAAWREAFARIDPARLVFLDETATTTAMDRTYGRAASGKRVDGPAPHGHCKVTTLTAAVHFDGLVRTACLARDRATNAHSFEGDIEQGLVPSSRPGDIVILDNLASHKSAEVARLVGSVGAEVRFLPASSPDLNPIEHLFSKPKQALRSAAARTFDALIDAIGEALRSIRPSDITGWFAHCGHSTVKSTSTLNEKSLSFLERQKAA